MPSNMLSKSEMLNLLRMRHALRATYLMWRIGINPRYTIARETYLKHRLELLNRYGIDINDLSQKEP